MTRNGVPGTDRPPSLTRLPSYLATQVGRIGRQLLSDALERRGLRPPHFATLAALSDFGPLPQHDLADRLGFNRSHAVGYLDALEQRGLLRRERDRTDRCRHVVALTGEGRALFDELDGVALASQDRFLRALDDDERRVLVGLLRRVLESDLDDRGP